MGHADRLVGSPDAGSLICGHGRPYASASISTAAVRSLLP